jgi:[acyl-carrier-protein] S-malonyltransferase
MRRVFMFPGQSSADDEMVARALTLHPAAGRVAARARAVLGDGVASRYLAGPRVPLESNRDVQIAVFLATQMHLASLQAAGIDADDSLGLSLGEYSHLVHIGALSFEDALALVALRGALYDESPPGVMVAILGPVEDEVVEVVTRTACEGCLVISNFNTPTQHVLAGEADAVACAAERLEDDHGAQAVVIERRVPMHSPLMEDVATRYRPCLAAVRWKAAKRAYRPNVLGKAMDTARPADYLAMLTAHVSQPVQWRRALEQLASAHPDATFIEVGPGRVLHGMLGRRWLAVARAFTDCRAGDDERRHVSATPEARHADL